LVSAVAGMLSPVVAALWAALQRGTTRELGRLEERARQAEKRADDITERLGKRIDDLQEARAADATKMARAVMAARAGADDWETEAPTGVRDMVAISTRPAKPDPLPELAHWDPTEPTPPRPYRARIKSHTGGR
jgi:hypothetical protein